MAYYESDPIQLTLDTELDLSAANKYYIKYEQEGGTPAQVSATKGTQTVIGTIPKDTTIIGRLYYQPFVSWDNGVTYYHGDKKYKDIEKKITVA